MHLGEQAGSVVLADREHEGRSLLGAVQCHARFPQAPSGVIQRRTHVERIIRVAFHQVLQPADRGGAHLPLDHGERDHRGVLLGGAGQGGLRRRRPGPAAQWRRACPACRRCAAAPAAPAAAIAGRAASVTSRAHRRAPDQQDARAAPPARRSRSRSAARWWCC